MPAVLSERLRQLAYQYAAKGACLVLVARREWSLWQVADRAFELGVPDVIILPGDVAPDDYNRFVQATIDHYGQWRPWKA
ncbi:11-beta-hydroxysteroid dehydrogenase A [Aegilops tauschii subsp. strangulata]|uniref:11-beta-hydroxysteroid dehydrogenase A n=1 Tax=Aegilops tauschii subsp. strangulata TaxID=200361 RepID=UPI001ABC8996|nr:11-beta-hydroxysteroid dehydrogenase A isoform X2 [Aegilops tauschii subsp. strangulata]